MFIKVKVLPKSSQNQIVGFEGEHLKVKCTAAPDKGKANASVIGLLAKYYGVPRNAVQILKGKTHCLKIIQIDLSNQKHTPRSATREPPQTQNDSRSPSPPLSPP